MSTFADSSAVVKLYTDEAGHEIMAAIPALVIARIARVEVVAALWRKQRMGELSADAARLLTEEFELDYFGSEETSPRFAVIAESATILDEAVRTTRVHGLRAYDAVQLAAANTARAVDSRCHTFAVFNKQLREAAAAEGYALAPPG